MLREEEDEAVSSGLKPGIAMLREEGDEALSSRLEPEIGSGKFLCSRRWEER
jgi:hypothetical protein